MLSNSDQQSSLQLMILSATFYGICSGSMNFANKFLLNSWGFTQPGLILFMQLLFLIICLQVLSHLGIIKLISYNRTTASSCWLLSALYSSNTFLALSALSGMNVPMYAAMRRCVPMASAILAFLVFGKKTSRLVTISIVLITIGAVVAAAGDLKFDMKSYILGSLSAILMASYLSALQYNGLEKQMTSYDLLYVNSINCLPIVALMSLGTLNEVLSFPAYAKSGFILSFILVILTGAMLNFSMFLCTTVNSALTTTCVGVLKSGVATVIGMFAFGGVEPTPLFITGLIINFFGGLLFAYGKYQQAVWKQVPQSSTPVQKI